VDDARKVLLDTDIGNDIDDAVALAYLLAQPRCDLLGITTVTADPLARAKLVSVLCRAAGRDVPIYPGAPKPLAVAPLQEPPPQAAALARWPHDERFPAGEAIQFLRRTIRAHPGEVTLLTIGPLTNAALLFTVDPEIPSLLRALVMMGGAFVTGPREAEWNLRNDPHAAHRVFATPVAVHRAIGLDVTTRVRMSSAAFLDRCDTPVLRPVADMAASWFAERGEVTFHDPLAAAVVFDEGLCRFARGEVAIDTADGTASFRPGAAGPHEVAVDVHADAVLEHYFAVVAPNG
jgi:purine nucleosidase